MNAAAAMELLRRLVHSIAPEANLDDADPLAQLRDSLELDSLDFVTLLEHLRVETGIVVPVRDLPRLSSVDGFVRYVCEVSGDQRDL